MRTVCSLQEARKILLNAFPRRLEKERAPLAASVGRVLGEDVVSGADVPAFDRSTVDGYAIRGGDSFGCSETLPAMLALIGRVEMGQSPDFSVGEGQCAYVPTGGALPRGADAVVMLEYVEEEGGLALIQRPAAPGANLILRGDDVKSGERLLPAGRRITPGDVGALSALGISAVTVMRRPVVAVLSTGNEVVPPECEPAPAQVRDVNGPMLCALSTAAGAEAEFYGILPDTQEALAKALKQARRRADLILLSGGSSVGERDAAAKTIEALGSLLFHGIAVKPGKPTLAGSLSGTPVLGLPGHPLAAFFMFRLLAVPLLAQMTGEEAGSVTVTAALADPVPSNHGREEYLPVKLAGGRAQPLQTKSGVISVLARADGCIRVPRDCEGLGAGALVEVELWKTPGI